MSKRPYKFKTSTSKEVRVSLSKVFNLMANGDMDTTTGKALVYTANAILQSIRIDEQEKQIEELRELIEEIKGEKK